MLSLEQQEISFAQRTSGEVRARPGNVTFTAATGGDHGHGAAWAAQAVNLHSVIYVDEFTFLEGDPSRGLWIIQAGSCQDH